MTTIVGKDAPLEQSIAHFQEILKNLKISVRESNWLNPLNDELFERLSTHMSFSDYYLGLDNSNAPYVHFKDEKWTVIDQNDPQIPNDVLNSSLRKFYSEGTDLNLEDLVDLQSSAFSRGVCSIPFTNARNGEVVYFPVNLLELSLHDLQLLLREHYKKELVCCLIILYIIHSYLYHSLF